MEYKIQFTENSEIEVIINDNKDLFLKSICYLNEGNFIIFSTEEGTPTLEEQVDIITKEQSKKISILESENADLLLDSANKDLKIQTIEKDLADLTIEIIGGM